MKQLKLEISKIALNDLQEIWDFIAKGSQSNADSFVNEILKKCTFLSSSPEIGRKRDDLARGIRTFPLKRYVIFYKIKGETFYVVRILSGYRDIDSLL